MMYDIIVIGGGPAAVAAGVYGARKKLKTLVIAEEFGGQSLVSADVQNWIGTPHVSGYDLGKMLEGHLRAQADIEIVDADRVTTLVKSASGFTVATKRGKSFETKTVLIASGSRRRRLGIPGEDKLDGKGVAYCSICDAPLFGGRDVAVIGGGNAGLEAVIDLFPYAAKVYLLERNATLRGDAVTQAIVLKNPKLAPIFNVATLEILGDTTVTGLRYQELPNGATKELAVGGVFVEIGAIPNGEFVKDLVALNKFGEIIVDPRTQTTSVPGIWAAGDVTDVVYKQNNIAAGHAITAVLNLHEYLNKNS